jgi:hypothetical protein
MNGFILILSIFKHEIFVDGNLPMLTGLNCRIKCNCATLILCRGWGIKKTQVFIILYDLCSRFNPTNYACCFEKIEYTPQHLLVRKSMTSVTSF